MGAANKPVVLLAALKSAGVTDKKVLDLVTEVYKSRDRKHHENPKALKKWQDDWMKRLEKSKDESSEK